MRRDLETIVRKAMAKEIASRYVSAAEMAEDLRLYLEDRPLKNARHTTDAERAYRWCRRNPMVAGLGAAAAALLLAVLVVSTVAAIREKKSIADLARELKNVDAAKKQAMKQLARRGSDREKGEKLWEANLATARASRYSGRSGRRFDALAALARAAELGRQLGHQPESFSKLRNEAIAALALPDLKITEEFGQWTSDLVSVDVNADFELFATSDHSGRCIVRRVADDVEVARLPRRAGRGRSSSGPIAGWRTSTNRGPCGSGTSRRPCPRSVSTTGERWRAWISAPRRAGRDPACRRLPDDPRAAERPEAARPAAPAGLEGVHDPVAPELALPGPHLFFLDLRQPHPPGDGRVRGGEAPLAGRPIVPGRVERRRADPDDPRQLGQGVAIYEFAGDPPVARLSRNGRDHRAVERRLNRSGDRLFSRGENNLTVMKDLISGRVLFEPPGFIALPISPPILKVDRERRRLFPARVDDPVRRFGYWSVAEGQECRLIVPDSPKMIGLWVGDQSRRSVGDGVSGQRVLFYDIDRGREAGSIPFGDLGTSNFYVALVRRVAC